MTSYIYTQYVDSIRVIEHRYEIHFDGDPVTIDEHSYSYLSSMRMWEFDYTMVLL